jgi:hypothetical protein
MTEDEHRVAVAALTPAKRGMFRAIEQHGPLTAQDLRQPFALVGERDWPGRRGSGWDEFGPLVLTGLIHQVDERRDPSGRGPSAKVWAVTPLEMIELVAARARKAKRRRAKGDGSTKDQSRQIAEYRAMEKEAGLSARSYWIIRRRRIVEMARDLRQIRPMPFWKAVRDDELEEVFEQLVDLREWADRMIGSIDTQRASATLRERIAQMRNTNGREPHEAALYRAKADEMEKDLL